MYFLLPLAGGGYATTTVEDGDQTLAGSLQAKIQSVSSVTNDSPPPQIQADVLAQVIPTTTST
jgi:hypothetical protein